MGVVIIAWSPSVSSGISLRLSPFHSMEADGRSVSRRIIIDPL